MTAEEIVKRLRNEDGADLPITFDEAADLIERQKEEIERLRNALRERPNTCLIAYEDGDHQRLAHAAIRLQEENLRQAKALSECQRDRAEFFDRLHGTPCEQIRHAQEVEELKKALEEAEKALEPFANCNGHWGAITIGDLRRSEIALATIRAARGANGDKGNETN